MSRSQRRRQNLSASRGLCIAYLRPDDVAGEFCDSLADLIWHDAGTVDHIKWKIKTMSGPRVAHARNQIVRQFLNDTTCDWLLFIDADMVFTYDLVDRMLAVADVDEVPILGALCFAGGKGALIYPTVYLLDKDEEGNPLTTRWDDYPRDQVFRCDATGAACLMIHRRVLVEIEKVWDPKTISPWFAETEYARRPFGEDITFCMRAIQAGFPIYVDSRIKVGHRKSYVLDEALYDEQQAKVTEVGGELEFTRQHFERLGQGSAVKYVEV